MYQKRVKYKHRKEIDVERSLSEPDLTTADRHHWNIAGLPPGITVDELWLFRKKRSPGLVPEDHLKLEEGAFNRLKTEYQRRYLNFFSNSTGNLPVEDREFPPIKMKRPPGQIKLEGQLELNPEYDDVFVRHQIVKQETCVPKNTLRIADNADSDKRLENGFLSEIRSKYVPYNNVEKLEIIRRPNNLKLEGDVSSKTENAEKFIEFLFNKRPELSKQVTTLKLEGEMEKKTETSEKFLAHEHQQRPLLCKKHTNLHLEGDLDIYSNYCEKYPAHEPQKRPPLSKRHTNLHMSGELVMSPEYREAYVEFKAERQRPMIPLSDNLKTDGFPEPQNDAQKTFIHESHHQIPFLREPDGKWNKQIETERSLSRRPEQKLDRDMRPLRENKQFGRARNNLALEGNLELSPEYKNAYVNFYKEEGKRSPVRRHLISQPGNLKTEGKMETKPEYRSAYVNFPRERPSIRRPQCHLPNENEKYNFATEKSSKYVSYPEATKAGLLKREPELKLEGRFECQPEYRKAYIDYLIRERVDRKPRPLDNLGTQVKRAFDVYDSQESTEKAPPKNPECKAPLKPESSVKPSHIPVVVKKTSPSINSSDTDSKQTKQTSALSSVRSKVPKASKLPVKTPNSRGSSRNPSPISATTRRSIYSESKTSSKRNEDEEIMGHISRLGHKFPGHVSVQDLAYRSPSKNPISDAVRSIGRNKRHKEVDSRSRAFLVLERDDKVKSDRVSSNLYKEQKWMPSWYKPPP